MEQDLTPKNTISGNEAPGEEIHPADYLDTLFPHENRNYEQYGPGALAFLGDAVFTLVIRLLIVRKHDRQAYKLHNEASHLVRAGTQSRMIRALEPHLSEEEAAVCRRGRNSDPKNTAKNATRDEYLDATGFETLIGYLYLNGRKERMLDLIAMGLKETEKRKRTG